MSRMKSFLTQQIRLQKSTCCLGFQKGQIKNVEKLPTIAEQASGLLTHLNN